MKALLLLAVANCARPSGGTFATSPDHVRAFFCTHADSTYAQGSGLDDRCFVDTAGCASYVADLGAKGTHTTACAEQSNAFCFLEPGAWRCTQDHETCDRVRESAIEHGSSNDVGACVARVATP